MTQYTEDEIFQTIFAQAVQEELDREIVDFLVSGTPISSTPIVFDSIEDEEAFKKAFDTAVNRKI